MAFGLAQENPTELYVIVGRHVITEIGICEDVTEITPFYLIFHAVPEEAKFALAAAAYHPCTEILTTWLPNSNLDLFPLIKRLPLSLPFSNSASLALHSNHEPLALASGKVHLELRP